MPTPNTDFPIQFPETDVDQKRDWFFEYMWGIQQGTIPLPPSSTSTLEQVTTAGDTLTNDIIFTDPSNNGRSDGELHFQFWNGASTMDMNIRSEYMTVANPNVFGTNIWSSADNLQVSFEEAEDYIGAGLPPLTLFSTDTWLYADNWYRDGNPVGDGSTQDSFSTYWTSVRTTVNLMIPLTTFATWRARGTYDGAGIPQWILGKGTYGGAFTDHIIVSTNNTEFTSPIICDAGTEINPGITLATDQDTGFYWISTDIWCWSAAGVNRARFSGSYFWFREQMHLSVSDSAPSSTGSLLELTSTTQALTVPRMTTAQRNAIPNPIAGMIVFNTSVGANGALQVRNASSWVNT